MLGNGVWNPEGLLINSYVLYLISIILVVANMLFLFYKNKNVFSD